MVRLIIEFDDLPVECPIISVRKIVHKGNKVVFQEKGLIQIECRYPQEIALHREAWGILHKDHDPTTRCGFSSTATMSDVDSPLVPIRPTEPVDADKVDDHDAAFEHPEDAGVDVERGDARLDVEEAIGGADEDSVVRPQLFPSPKAPSAAEIELHNATRLPYRNWCPSCVAGRSNNTPHRELGGKHRRSEPCLHLDYCFLPDEVGTATLIVLVGKLEHPKLKLDQQSNTFA